MHVQSIKIQGFAHFVEPVIFGPLGDVNVVYGPNNSGKSMLLAALDLYFRMLGAGEAVTKAQRHMLDRPEAEVFERITAGFSRVAPMPIRFDVEWRLTEADLDAAGLFPDYACAKVITVLEAEAMGRTIELRTPRWQLQENDVAALDRGKDAAVVAFAQQIRRLLADAQPFKFEQPVHPVARLGTSTELFPQSLRDALFDARQSREAPARRRWALFAEMAGTLRAELGGGSWDTTFDRSTNRADLIYLTDSGAVSLDSLGAGVQRLAALAAEIALAEVPYLVLEEPEWLLSPAYQSRLIALAKRAAASGTGARQLFISTHSPTLAALGTPFALDRSGPAPTMEQKAWTLSPEAGVLEEDLDLAPASEDLSPLINLVDTLAGMEPEQLLSAGRR